jgi:hypothetical protein
MWTSPEAAHAVGLAMESSRNGISFRALLHAGTARRVAGKPRFGFTVGYHLPAARGALSKTRLY